MPTQESPDKALYWAAYYGKLEEVQRLLEKEGANPKWRSSSDGDTALHNAVRGDHTAIVRLLVDHGVEPNAMNHNGDTALHRAAHRAHTATVRLLVLHGAHPAATNNDGKTARQLASGETKALLAELETPEGLARLKAAEFTASPEGIALCAAVRGGDAAALCAALDGGMPVDTKDAQGVPLVQLAAAAGHAALVAELLGRGAAAPDLAAKAVRDGDNVLLCALRTTEQNGLRCQTNAMAMLVAAQQAAASNQQLGAPAAYVTNPIAVPVTVVAVAVPGTPAAGVVALPPAVKV